MHVLTRDQCGASGGSTGILWIVKGGSCLSTPDFLECEKSRDGGPGDTAVLVIGNFKNILCHDSCCIENLLHPDRHKIDNPGKAQGRQPWETAGDLEAGCH